MYDDEIQIDITKLRYVLPQRQIRSINDQIEECRSMARRLGITIVATIKEEKSAKKPDKRSEFNKVLEGINSKQYDAILAWNPDRLARNMKEGGELIDMVDEGLIKDLKFVTHHFTPDANGKMLLGMAFVLSKQYSDKLSQDVTRGVKRGFNEGKSSGTYKHGYVRDDNSGQYRPNGRNFELICDAWQMRKAGKSLEVIADYMNEQGYARTYKDKAAKAGQSTKITDKTLSARVFVDSFYYGVLIQKGKQKDLREIDGYDFMPATDEKTYNYVQGLTGRRVVTERKRNIFKPLVGMITYYYCKGRMIPQTPLSGRKAEKVKILSYRCDNLNCPRKKKELKLSQSVRAKVVFDFMYDMLKGLDVTRDDYDKLLKRLHTANSTKLQEQAVAIHSKQGGLKSVQGQIKEISLKIIKLDPSSPVFKSSNTHVNELAVQEQELIDQITKLEREQSNPQTDIMSFEEFLNVAKNADKHLRAADIVVKDRIARLIYLNVVVDDQKVVDYQIREPFKTYFQMHKISNGRGDRT